MATTTKTVNIQLEDQLNQSQTFRIDYPATDTTLASIKLALAPAMATNAWRSSYGGEFMRVKGAVIVETEKTKLDEGTGTVSIIPTEATITTSGNTGSQNFIIEGMTTTGYAFQFLKGDTSITPNYQLTKIENNNLIAVFDTPTAGTAYYNVIVTSGPYTFTLPTTITKT